MLRSALLACLARTILAIGKDAPILVGIDGVDASGKTTLANELLPLLQQSGREIIRASIDGFHQPESIRYARGRDSPEGYYHDSFNYAALREVLLHSLQVFPFYYQTAVFDYRTNGAVTMPILTASPHAILLMEGVFLFRPELVDFWDLKVWMDVDFDVSVARAIRRDAEREHIGGAQAIRDKYDRRYVPGQQLYLAQVQPEEKADIVIDNADVTQPRITKGMDEY